MTLQMKMNIQNLSEIIQIRNNQVFYFQKRLTEWPKVYNNPYRTIIFSRWKTVQNKYFTKFDK